MARRGRAARAPRAPSAGRSSGAGAVYSGMSSMRETRVAIRDVGEIGSSLATAAMGGQSFNAAQNAPALMSILGGLIGLPFGGMVGAMLGSAAGSAFGGVFQTMNSAFANSQVAGFMGQLGTGYGPGGNYYSAIVGLSGAPDRFNMASNGPAGISPMIPGTIGAMEAGMAMGMLGPMGQASNGDAFTVAGVASRLVSMYGAPLLPGGASNQAFAGAVNALMPAMTNPALAPGFESSISHGAAASLPGIRETIAALGPGAAFAALSAGGLLRGPQDFATENNRIFFSQMNLQAGSTLMGGSAAKIAGATMGGGDREDIISAYEADIAGARGMMSAYHQDANIWRSGAARLRPYSRQRLLSDYTGEAGMRSRMGIDQFQMATAGPSAEWRTRTSELGTEEQVAMLDPFFPFVPVGARRSLVSLYGSRISQIESQTEGNPTARAAMAPELSSLRIAQAQESNALRMGIMGQALDIYAGRPSGFQEWGLAGMSFSAMQRAIPGAPAGLGGSGEISAGEIKETNRLLTQILLAISNNRSLSPSGSEGNFFSLAPDRANKKVGR